MLASILFFLVVGVIVTLFHSVRKAKHDDEIRFLCPQYGYTYLDDVPIEELGPLPWPPWSAFRFGLMHEVSRQTLTLRRPTGVIVSGQFYGKLYRGEYDSAARKQSEPCTVTWLTLLDRPAQQHLVDFCVGLQLTNGLHVLVRGNTIYALFGPRNRRSMAMSYREQFVCMVAMQRMLEGDLQRAEAGFNSIAGASLARVSVNLVAGAVALWLWGWIYTQSGFEPGIVLGPGAVILLSWLYVRHRWRKDEAELWSYLALRAQG